MLRLKRSLYGEMQPSLYGPLFQERDQEIWLFESRLNWDFAVSGDFAVW